MAGSTNSAGVIWVAGESTGKSNTGATVTVSDVAPDASVDNETFVAETLDAAHDSITLTATTVSGGTGLTSLVTEHNSVVSDLAAIKAAFDILD